MDNSLAPRPEAPESRSPKRHGRGSTRRGARPPHHGRRESGVSSTRRLLDRRECRQRVLSLTARGEFTGRAFGSACYEEDPDAETHRHGSRRVPAGGDYREDSRPPPVWRTRKRLAATRSPVFWAVTSASG